ncbi:hypothetical protein [Kamptonema sp. UHCC 0994]|uniref:hypothetical protein n=1 Tax=Kamptonema sp. UHCC 0994 TaxID=3031329 RepID=UPI0023BA258D|nr:hypothetical protein [Kamptonema sp. UHCC 0994]MDF0553628.1 hypothetical protein [Kamptonema sp. UHCC 0994]
MSSFSDEEIYREIGTIVSQYDVEVRGRVFDNLSTQGMFRTEWVKDFSCPSDGFVVEELENFD